MIRNVPGLSLYTHLLPKEALAELQKRAIGLHEAIVKNSEGSSTQQCSTFISKYHNLQCEAQFQYLKIEDDEGKITAQHFQRYGGEGHTLTYFIGNQNIPSFVKKGFLHRLNSIPEIGALTRGKLNFTFNTYTLTDELKLAGFDFHKDIPSNGVTTTIYSLGAPSQFQIRHPSKPDLIVTIPLLSNSLLVIDKEARWDYEHRVLSVKVNDAPLVGEVRRISMVLGFTPSL